MEFVALVYVPRFEVVGVAKKVANKGIVPTANGHHSSNICNLALVQRVLNALICGQGRGRHSRKRRVVLG